MHLKELGGGGVKTLILNIFTSDKVKNNIHESLHTGRLLKIDIS